VTVRSRLGGVKRRVLATLPRRPPDDPIGRIVFAFGRAYPDAVFVQVGANDGVGHDLLIDEVESRRWRGVLVEPVPYVFERLQANHGANPRLELDNVAIADVDGSRELYYLDAAEPGAPLPDWYDKLGSFNRDVIAKHAPAIPDFDRRLRAEPVRCVTFETLCRTHGLTSVDLVQIDTEGYDFEIIKLIDLDRLTPRLVIYEHLHFDADTRAACSAHMEARGYEEISDVVNTVALRTSGVGPRDDRLVTTWRRVAAEAASWSW
jgi:FkbM family methyltransferase